VKKNHVQGSSELHFITLHHIRAGPIIVAVHQVSHLFRDTSQDPWVHQWPCPPPGGHDHWKKVEFMYKR